MDRRHAIMAFSGILAIAIPRHRVFAQTPAESGQATKITPLQYKTQTLQVGTFSMRSTQRCFNNCKASQARALTSPIFRVRSSVTSSC
jgi:hypothetical protein